MSMCGGPPTARLARSTNAISSRQLPAFRLKLHRHVATDYPASRLLAVRQRYLPRDSMATPEIAARTSWASIGFIEFVRGVPLITVLFMASVMLPLF